jgi:Flp pilus assembly protein TadG
MRTKFGRKQQQRRGTVTVEFAIVAPVFLTLLLGVTEASRLFEMRNQLAIAAREGARMAAMDRSGLVSEGQTTNAKVVQDVKNFLQATGLDPDQVNVEIVSHEDPSQTFNLDDPANSLAYFEVRVSVPYNEVSAWAPPGTENQSLGAKIVFRNSKL